MTPAPAEIHQLVAGHLYALLHAYLRGSNVGRAIISPADVRRGDRTRNRVQPDVFVVRLHEGKRPSYPYDLGDLMLAIEIASPSDPRLDYQIKRELYFARTSRSTGSSILTLATFRGGMDRTTPARC